MTLPRKYSALVLVVIGFLLLIIKTPAQEMSKQAPTNSQQAMVLLNVRVTDEAGHPVTDVRQEDFRVIEDGAPQTISFFSKEEVPLSYGLLIDSSGSLRTQLGRVIEAGKFIISGNKSNDEAFLIRFISSDKIEQVRGFTSNQRLLMADLDGFYTEGGLTAIIDAVYLSIDYAAKNRKSIDGNRRLALVLVTDGEDRGSHFKRAELAELLHKEDIQIFVIGLVNQLEDSKARKKATELLKFLADETGGRAFFPDSISELRGISQEITRDMRTQYLIGYLPTSGNQSNTFHKVQITIADAQGRDRRIAVTRIGYIAAPHS
jgi:Ca-activated chloride channel family protein